LLDSALATQPLLASTMFAKRSAPNQESSDENRRPPKRFKPSPATPTALLASRVQRLADSLLQDIKKMPREFIIVGLDSALNTVDDEHFLATADMYESTLEYIDAQTKKFEDQKFEGELAMLVRGVTARLKGKLKHLPMVRQRLMTAM
jgi:hypothetical protein